MVPPEILTNANNANTTSLTLVITGTACFRGAFDKREDKVL